MRWQVQKAVLPIILLTAAIAVFFVLWNTQSMVEPTDQVALEVAEAVSEWVQPLRLVLHFLRRRT